jgi:hypothetical protein
MTLVNFLTHSHLHNTASVTAFSDLVVQSQTENLGSIYYEKNITVGVASQDKLSFLKLYYDYTSEFVYPYLTAIIDVDNGKVLGITWDDACVFCGSGQCQEITFNYNGIQQNQKSSGQPTKGCLVTEAECNIYESQGTTLCDVTIYVVWTGTDANGVAFQSSGFRFSQFPAQEIQDRISQMLPKTGEETRKLQAKDVPMDL